MEIYYLYMKFIYEINYHTIYMKKPSFLNILLLFEYCIYLWDIIISPP